MDELITLIPPPAEPLDRGTDIERQAIENELGIRLPNDLFEFLKHYGSGEFYGALTIYNPFAPYYVSYVRDTCRTLEKLRKEFPEEVLFPIFPEKSGLFPCAGDVSGGAIYWLTEGTPEEWPLIILSHSHDVERRDQTLTEFLRDLFTGRRDCILLDTEWLADARASQVEAFKRWPQFQ